jgi:hypothetical protein
VRDANCAVSVRGWYIEAMAYEALVGPFRTLAAATTAGQPVFADETGAFNPLWSVG